MDMKLGPGEPPAGPWRVTPISDVVHLVFDADRKRHDRPWIVAVDGRAGSGKSTIANLLHQSVPASELVHTDDVAWHHSFFDWSDLLVENILIPLAPLDTTWIPPNVSHRFRNMSATRPMKIFWTSRLDATRTLTETGVTNFVSAEHKK